MIDNILRATSMVLCVAGVVVFFAAISPKHTAVDYAVDTVTQPQNDFAFQKLVREYEVQGLEMGEDEENLEELDEFGTCPVE